MAENYHSAFDERAKADFDEAAEGTWSINTIKSGRPLVATQLCSYVALRATRWRGAVGYKDPTTVVAPKTRWKFGKVLCSTGQGGFSVAEGWWDSDPTLGIRWNGDDDSGSPGNPQSHGNATWFIVPEELKEAVRGVAFSLDEAMSFVTFTSERPKDFEFGVFVVTVEVKGQVRKAIEGRGVTFEIPTLPKRFFRHDLERGYGVPPLSDKAPWKGRFVDGVWKAIVQTNGISEEENPTSMKVVEDALIARVMTSLAPWKSNDLPPLVAHHVL